MCIATVPSRKRGAAFLYAVPAPAGQPSAGIKPSVCQPTNVSAKALKPSSTRIGTPFSWNLAPYEKAGPAHL